MFGVDTPAQTMLWKALNEIIDFRKEHDRDPSEIRLSKPDWDEVVAGSFFYDPDDSDPDKKIYLDPETAPDVGELFGIKAIKDETVEVGHVRIS